MAVDWDDVDDDDDRDMFLFSLLLFWNAALQRGPCDLPLVWVMCELCKPVAAMACGRCLSYTIACLYHTMSALTAACASVFCLAKINARLKQEKFEQRFVPFWEPVLPNDFPEIPCSLIETHFCPFTAVHPLQVLP